MICKITTEVNDVATYDLSLANPSAANAYRFQPGQFNMLYVPGAGESAISMSGNPDSPENLVHTIRVAGNVTRSIAAMKVGDTLGLRGPFGTSWPLEACAGRDVILVAGGIGLPPMRPLLFRLLAERQRYGRIHLLYGARSPDMRLYTEDYPLWSESGVEIKEIVDHAPPGWHGNVGVVPLLLERLEAFDPTQAILMICGPELMMHFTARMAMQRGMTSDQIWVSTERNMQCAVGLCGHCQLGPEFICKNGPIFRYDQISPYLRVEGL